MLSIFYYSKIFKHAKFHTLVSYCKLLSSWYLHCTSWCRYMVKISLQYKVLTYSKVVSQCLFPLGEKKRMLRCCTAIVNAIPTLEILLLCGKAASFAWLMQQLARQQYFHNATGMQVKSRAKIGSNRSYIMRSTFYSYSK